MYICTSTCRTSSKLQSSHILSLRLLTGLHTLTICFHLLHFQFHSLYYVVCTIQTHMCESVCTFSNLNIFLIGFNQVIVLSWVYGIDRVFDNLSQMNMKFSAGVRMYWWITWTLVTPIASFVSISISICV